MFYLKPKISTFPYNYTCGAIDAIGRCDLKGYWTRESGIGVIIWDPRILVKVLDILRKRNIKPLAPMNNIDISELETKTHIIIVDKYVAEKIKKKPPFTRILVIEREADIDKVVEEAICLFYGKKTYNEVTLGLDPGPDYVAYALIVDGILFESGKRDTNSIISYIINIITTIPYKRFYIRIGSNLDGVELAETIVSSINGYGNVFVEIVDEYSTTKHALAISEISKSHIRDKDIKAAINISFKNGSRIS